MYVCYILVNCCFFFFATSRCLYFYTINVSVHSITYLIFSYSYLLNLLLCFVVLCTIHYDTYVVFSLRENFSFFQKMFESCTETGLIFHESIIIYPEESTGILGTIIIETMPTCFLPPASEVILDTTYIF